MTTTVLRVAASFATVAVLLWLFARMSRGRLGRWLGGSSRRPEPVPLTIVARQQLTKTNSVAIMRAGRRHLLVGFGESGVQLLADGDDLALEPEDMNAVDLVGHGDAGAIELDTVAAGSGLDGVDQGPARTRPVRTDRSKPPRKKLVNALRDKTVRR